MGVSQYGDMTNWEVVECLEGEAFGENDVDDIVFSTRILIEVVQDWGRHANAYIDRAESAMDSGDERDATFAAFERKALERPLQRGIDAYSRLERAAVDVTWARGDWMTYEIPDYGFDQTTP